MPSKLSIENRFRGALYGMYIGDALAMPVHWYYDRNALTRDYGKVADYLSPKNPHPESELWKHDYTPAGPEDDILHDQAQYWGRRDIHYHQFLKAGENTLNIKLCNLLLRSLVTKKRYDWKDYLERLIAFMTTPGNHRDTYIDEYLRGFFKNYRKGIPLENCGIIEKHLSGLNGVVPMLIFYHNDLSRAYDAALQHVFLTHKGPLMKEAAGLFINMMNRLLDGMDAISTVNLLTEAGFPTFLTHGYGDWLNRPDKDVVDNQLGAGCYVDESLPVVIYLFLKYCKHPEAGLIANTNLGGNNAARGAILGALLGANNGLESFPGRWIKGLRHPPEAFIRSAIG